MSRGIVLQVESLLTKEGKLDHHSQMLQELLNHSNAQATQIAALKELLIEERAKYLASELYESHPDCCEDWLEDARKELTAKYPEAMK